MAVAKEMYEEGLLQPCYIQSEMRIIDQLTDDVLKYFDSQEGSEVLMASNVRDYKFIHPDKLSPEVQELVNIHPDKLPNEVKNKLQNVFTNNSQDWIAVDNRFASFYMTLLATRLSDVNGLGLLTDIEVNSKLANVAKLDSNIYCLKSRRSRYSSRDDQQNQNIPSSLAQGVLAHLTLEKIQIDPATPIKQLLKFRRSHADELGRFRMKVAELTKNISGDQPPERLRQQINDTFINEVSPSINALKEGLNDHMINWVPRGIISITMCAAPPTGILVGLLGTSIPQALLVGGGISLVASCISYNSDRAEKLRQNPFSYFLSAEKHIKPYKWM